MKIPAQIFYGRLLLALAGGLFCAALSYFHLLQPLDRMAYDIFNEASPLPVADDLVIVSMDERSLMELGRWPWAREKHVELLRQLRRAGAAAIAMDILFVERDSEYPEVDEMLAEAMRAHGAVVLPVFIGQATRGGGLRETPPLDALATAAAGLGHVHIEVDSDGVARSVFLREGLGQPRWPHFTVALSEVVGLDIGQLPGVTDDEVLRRPDPAAIIRSNANLIPFMGPAGTVAQISYVDVLKGRLPAGSLRDRIVFVGATAAGHVDNITTSHGQIAGVEVNANIFHALRSGRLGQPVSGVIAGSIVFAFAALTILLFTGLAPRQLLLGVLSSVVLLPLASYLAFYFWRLWLSPAPLVLTLLVAYPLWNWLRLDTAVDFIREQLVALERENRELSHSYTWADAERAANFLVSLGHVARWSCTPEFTADSVQIVDQQWRHSRSFSSRVFVFGAHGRRLTLYWQPGHESIRGLVGRIFPAGSAPTAEPGSGADFINVNLFQLDDAYSQARRNHELIRGTLEQLGSAVILAELSGDILLINRQVHELLRAETDHPDLLSLLASVELEDGAGILELVSKLVLHGDHFSREGRALAADREILCQGGVIGLERSMLLFVITDVAELKQAEKRRTEALNFLSHDLRAPLTSVLALIDGAKGRPSVAAAGPLLLEIEKYVRRNLSYAENFIQLARIEHTDSPRLDECDAYSLVDNAVSQLYHTARARGIKLHVSYGDEDIWVNCSRDLLERALINLLDNALKHSGDGGTIEIGVQCDADFAIFTISDQGEGIEPGDLERIFERFEQGTNARSGAGLGLRFVSAVAGTHAGSVTAGNIDGGGARFSLRIPRMSNA